MNDHVWYLTRGNEKFIVMMKKHHIEIFKDYDTTKKFMDGVGDTKIIADDDIYRRMNYYVGE